MSHANNSSSTAAVANESGIDTLIEAMISAPGSFEATRHLYDQVIDVVRRRQVEGEVAGMIMVSVAQALSNYADERLSMARTAVSPQPPTSTSTGISTTYFNSNFAAPPSNPNPVSTPPFTRPTFPATGSSTAAFPHSTGPITTANFPNPNLPTTTSPATFRSRTFPASSSFSMPVTQQQFQSPVTSTHEQVNPASYYPTTLGLGYALRKVAVDRLPAAPLKVIAYLPGRKADAYEEALIEAGSCLKRIVVFVGRERELAAAVSHASSTLATFASGAVHTSKSYKIAFPSVANADIWQDFLRKPTSVVIGLILTREEERLLKSPGTYNSRNLSFIHDWWFMAGDRADHFEAVGLIQPGCKATVTVLSDNNTGREASGQETGCYYQLG